MNEPRRKKRRVAVMTFLAACVLIPSALYFLPNPLLEVRQRAEESCDAQCKPHGKLGRVVEVSPIAQLRLGRWEGLTKCECR